MKSFKHLFLYLMFLTVGLSSCYKQIVGEGPVVTQSTDLSTFNGIKLSMAANVSWQQSDKYKIEIMAQQNIIDYLKVNVSGTCLSIDQKNNVNIKNANQIMIRVYSPDIILADVSGSGCIKLLDSLNAVNLQAKISGSGSITCHQVAFQSLNAEISGSGSIDILSGTCASLQTDVSGSGQFNLSNLLSNAVRTETSGSGSTRVHAIQSLDVDISGSGSVYYFGNPVISKKISGSGKVIKL